jgi:hypothetical protein
LALTLSTLPYTIPHQHGERGIDQAVNPGNVTDAPKSSHDVKEN